MQLMFLLIMTKKFSVIYWLNLLLEHFTRDSDVKLHTGFSDSSKFTIVFDQLAKKAQYMHYWRGMTNTTKDWSSPRDRKNVNLRKLILK